MEHFQSLLETFVEEIGRGDTEQCCSMATAGIEAQASFKMLDRALGATGEKIKNAAKPPTNGVARVESQRTFHEPERSTDILAEIAKHTPRSGQDHWVVGSQLKG